MTSRSNSPTHSEPFALQVKDERWTGLDVDWESLVTGTLPLVFDVAPTGPDGTRRGGEICVVLTDDTEIRSLNKAWRGKDTATNVLSFPSVDDPDFGRKGTGPTELAEDRILGDVVLAFETVAAEAADQDKSFRNHALHLLVHGVLHLLGYDHQTGEEAGQMEGLERRILARLDIADPYTVGSVDT